jgi:hypothetical protein
MKEFKRRRKDDSERLKERIIRKKKKVNKIKYKQEEQKKADWKVLSSVLVNQPVGHHSTDS